MPSRFFRQRDDSHIEQPLRIEPETIRLEEQVYEDGDMVRARFRGQHGDGPLMIEGIAHSCSCLASVAEGERKPPFLLAPKSSVEVALTTTAMSIRGSDQLYTATVGASLDGRRLPDRTAALTFRVADSLKVDPPSLQIYEARQDAATDGTIRLFTYRDCVRPEPRIQVRGSRLIRSSLRKPLADENQRAATVTHYVVDVQVEPDKDSETVVGEIEIVPPVNPRSQFP